MEVYILDRDYEIVGMIDEAESVLWDKKYNDIGESEIYIPCDEENLALLKIGHYLYRYDDDMFCKIESVEIETDVEDGDYIIATAKDICKILSGRVVRWQVVYSGTVAGFVQKVLTDNVINPAQAQRKISNFTIDTSNFSELTEPIDVSAFTEDLLQLILNTCKSAGFGFRVSFDIETHRLIFRLYRGKFKASVAGEEYVEFSPQFSNILSSNYKEDDSGFKNVAYVGYVGVDEQTHLLSLFKGAAEPQGEERREVYVDGTGTSRTITYEELAQMFPTVQKTTTTTEEKTVGEYSITEGGEKIIVATSEKTISATGEETEEQITVTDYTYLLLIRTIGQNALDAANKTQEFTGEVDTVDTYEYKKDYDIGDIVKVINEYGIEAAARVTAVLESDDTEDGYQCEPTFEYLS